MGEMRQVGVSGLNCGANGQSYVPAARSCCELLFLKRCDVVGIVEIATSTPDKSVYYISHTVVSRHPPIHMIASESGTGL